MTKMGRPAKPNRIKIFSNRAMVYLNGASREHTTIDIQDVPLVRRYTWCITRTMRNGKPRDGYVSAYIPNMRRRMLMHRVIMGVSGKEIVDHINHNTLDNRRSNLRLTSNSFNVFHTPKWGEDVGVWHDRKRGKWQAYIDYQGRLMHIGRFSSKEEAKEARLRAEVSLFGSPKPRSGK